MTPSTHVRAAATSANLGAGFDCAALALDLWNELEVSPGEGVVIEGEGADELPDDGTNLAIRAYALVASPDGKRFRFLNRIPLERGLGSSAAAIALGLAAGAPDAPPETLLALGGALEADHHDNLAAALVGGACLTWEGRIAKVADSLPLHPIAVVPSERTSTSFSRATLPQTIPHADGAYVVARAALLGAGLAAGNAGWLASALGDRLHEPYRPSRVLDSIRSNMPQGAAGATLSGSGPTVLVWADDVARCAGELCERFPDHRVLPLAVASRGALQ